MTKLTARRQTRPVVGTRTLLSFVRGGCAAKHGLPKKATSGPLGCAFGIPNFTWVRLAQRIPVRIEIDTVPDGVRLAAGMTATVQVDVRARGGPPSSP